MNKILESFSNLRSSKLATTVIVAVSSALGITGTTFWPRDPVVQVPVSAAQQQILEAGLAGKPSELNGKLARVVRDHFAEKGFPCDPVTASERVGETVERAKACAPVPAASGPN